MTDREPLSGYSTAKIVRATTASAMTGEDWKQAWMLAVPVVVAAGRFLDVSGDPRGTPELREDAHFQLLRAVTQYVYEDNADADDPGDGRDLSGGRTL